MRFQDEVDFSRTVLHFRQRAVQICFNCLPRNFNGNAALLSVIFTLLIAFGMCFTAISPAIAGDRFVENGSLRGNREVVDISGSWHVTGAGLARLRSYVIRGEVRVYVKNEVRVLRLSGTRIGDSDLKQLEGDDGLTELEEISLGDTEVSDVGLESLAGLKNLRRIDLGHSLIFEGGVSGVRVSEAGLAKLKRALPECRIEHERRAIELSDEQRRQFELWSSIATVRLNDRGEIVALIMHGDKRLTTEHQKSLVDLKSLSEFYAGSYAGEDVAAEGISAKVVAMLSTVSSLKELCLRGSPLDDAAVAPLAKLEKLEVLDLTATHITDTGLKPLQGLSNLKAVSMKETTVRKPGLQGLRKFLPDTRFEFDAWRVVDLPYRRLTVNENFELADVGSIGRGANRKKLATDLTRLLDHPSVERIDLRHTAITDKQLEIIAKMSNLTHLDLGNTKITSAGLQHLQRLDRLEWLNLWHTRIAGDGGFAALEMLMSLGSLELDETRIDDSALPIIARIGSLHYLELWHTDVTRAGVARLAEQREDIEIKANPRQ